MPTSLRVPPSGRVRPPIATKADYLPLDQLPWPDAERLFLRLAELDGQAEYAELYGTAGQGQEGIDLFVRNTRGPAVSAGTDPGRRYTTLQSKRVATLTSADIIKAVDKFLAGSWADRSEVFIYATTHALRPTTLAEELERQADRAEKAGIRLERWGRESVSERLRQLPEIVDDFFGRAWVAEFCGPEAEQALAGRLPGQDVEALRAGLRSLYRASFALQDTGAVLLAPAVSAHPPKPLEYVLLDITDSGGEFLGSPSGTAGEQSSADERRDGRGLPSATGPGAAGTAEMEQVVDGYAPWSYRDAVPAVDRLLERGRVEDELGGLEVTRSACDEWLADGDLSVVAGGPGAGKSSLLRFVVSDLLDDSPRSAALVAKFGSHLPVWLPFSFLCAYIKEDAERSVESAVRAWLTRYSAQHLHDLVAGALADDRLLLVVDGLDEWTDEDSAHPALTLLENFVRSRNVAAIVSSRPYALRRLMPLAGWRVGNLAPLSAAQQQSMTRAAFARAVTAEPAPPAGEQEAGPAAQRLMDETADRFLDEVKAVADLKALAAVPLFLLMLAGMWSRGPLPTRRMQAYRRLVDVLIEQHPAIRRRDVRRPAGGLDTRDIRQVLAAVAYELRQADTGPAASTRVWRASVVRALCDDDLFGYDGVEARRLAPQIMEVAEGDLGILLAQGAGTLGFAHRAVAEQLCAEHLMTLPLASQQAVVRSRAGSRSWRDVLLALLAGQDRPSDAAELLQTALDAGPKNSTAELGGHELAAEALAAGVRMPHREVTRFAQLLCARVEHHPWMPHRARLLAALTGALAETTARRVLLPWFARKTIATTDEPNAYWSLRRTDIAVPDAETILLQALRHPSDAVKHASAHALAQRMAGTDEMAQALAVLACEGSDTTIQAAALEALVTGWPGHTRTMELISWGMRQGAIGLRAVALRAHRALRRDTPQGMEPYDENDRQWLLSLLERDSVGDVLDRVTAEMVSDAAQGDESVRDLCLAILSGTPGRPGTPGWRELAWWVVLTAFPQDSRVVQWAARKIASDDYLPYSLANAPAAWADEPAIRDAAQTRLLHESFHPADNTFHLARLARTGQVRDHLISALDATFGTAVAARALQEHFGDDPVAREALLRKINGPVDDAVSFVEVVATVLRPTDGIDHLLQLIQQRPREGVQHAIAALASLWIDCKNAVRGEPSPVLFDQAEHALEHHDAQALACVCLDAVPGENFGTARGWIIGAWPEVPEVLTYARQCLTGADPEAGPVLIGYGPLNSPQAAQIIAEATALLNPLPPALRVLIAQQLTRRGIDTETVTELLKEWRHDTSSPVRRAAATALARTLAVTPVLASGSDGATSESTTAHTNWQQAQEKLRAECRQELLSYDLNTGDDRRRTAWVIVLLLGDVTLLEGVVERNNGRPASAEFDDPLSGPDLQLTKLVATHWTALQQQCGNQLLERLTGRLSRTPPELTKVWATLATVAARHPELDRALSNAVRADPELLHDKDVFAWYADTNPDDPGLLRQAAQAARADNDPQPVLHVAGKLLPLDAHRRELLELLIRPPGRKPSPQLISDDDIDMAVTGWCRIALARLLPDDPHAHSLYRALQQHLAGTYRIDWTWPEAIAVTINLAPAAHVPHLTLRIAERLQRRSADFAAPTLFEAAAHRIRRDPQAEQAMIDAITSPDTMDTSATPWHLTGRTYTAAPSQPAHQQILLAGILATATGLPADVAAALAPLADSDSVLHDNPLMTPRPIRLAVLDLLDTVR
ncbi:NACHT domain-containing protein [Streptomyces sp. MnatMP-M17]|uniref:NACHT domain-containing protein n=1 Tax=unclassified Streptomyces TaxID=2593676 RepID=UPI00136C195B|nr:NACHT domain-containing protein [Streptomyces sp. MnatMP-M17]MYZ34894.1 NACHT domain-containing protein [Streptomyces sp. SID4917]